MTEIKLYNLESASNIDACMKKLSEIQYGNTLESLCEEVNKLNEENKKLKEALQFYGSPELWDKEKFLVGSDLLREDLEETNYSRYTPGKLAREILGVKL